MSGSDQHAGRFPGVRNDFIEVKRARDKKKVLIFSEYYLPGYKSGGGMRTIVNIVDALGEKIDFYIVTNCHDGRSDRTPYETVKIDEWNDIGNAKVFYIKQNKFIFSKMIELFLEVDPDIVYSNSYFSTFNTQLLVLNKLGKLGDARYLISPCGELSDGAMKVSLRKKKAFVLFANTLKLHKNIDWKATNESERAEIENLSVVPRRIHIAPDLIGKRADLSGKPPGKPQKLPGHVKFVFLSRYSEKKNFGFFLDALRGFDGNITVDIYGPIDAPEYWKECRRAIAELPANIAVNYCGAVPHEEVYETLCSYHFFVMPTLGENFGHVFLEAWAAGCPLLISDRTPWNDLEKKGLGWALPLENREVWIDTIHKCLEMEEMEYKALSVKSIEFARNYFNENDFEEITLRLLSGL